MSAALALVLLCLLVVQVPGAQAQGKAAEPVAEAEKPDPIDAQMAACIDKDPSTAGMMGCAAGAEAAWDKAMNEIYRVLVRELKGAALLRLREAQRSWLAQRDSEFRLQDALLGQLQGTMWGPVMADQRVTHVKNRVLQLRAYLEFLNDGRP